MNCFGLVSNAGDGTIGIVHLDGTTGVLKNIGQVDAGPAVMPLALSTDQNTVMAATRGAHPALVAFHIDRSNGTLSLASRVAIASSKAYLTMDQAGRYVFGASYGENRLGVYSPHGDAAPLQMIDDIAHAHSVLVSKNDRFAYVASLGSDTVLGFEIDRAVDEHPTPGPDIASPASPTSPPLSQIVRMALPSGFGPRHMRFSPQGDRLYVLSEFTARIAVFAHDPQTGQLTLASISPRPASLERLDDGFARPNFNDPVQPDPKLLERMIWAADLHVHPNGRFLYASERTSSTLLTFHLSADGATLEPVSATPTERQPRGFRIDPEGKFLVACGEKSSQVVAYRIDPDDGHLTQTSRLDGGNGANWIELVPQI